MPRPLLLQLFSDMCLNVKLGGKFISYTFRIHKCPSEDSFLVFPHGWAHYAQYVVNLLTSVEHQSWIMEMILVSFICRVNAASHSGSISMCCPTCLNTGSIPWVTRHICEMDALKLSPSTCAGEQVFCSVTCIHLSSSRKESRPSRNLILSWSVQSDGRLIRTYLNTIYKFPNLAAISRRTKKIYVLFLTSSHQSDSGHVQI